jgi:signal transduction histidine kinase
MRRLSLSTKLIAAALPLIVAVAALLTVTVRSDLNEVQRAESGADLGALWDPLITALTAVDAEVGSVPDIGEQPAASTTSGRRATDQAVNDLRSAVEGLIAFEAAAEHITASRSALSAARRNLDMAAIAPEMQTEVDPLVAYDTASRELISVGQLLPSEAGSPALGRELLAVVKLAEAKLEANTVIAGTLQWPNDDDDRSGLVQARGAFTDLDAVLNEFEAIAPEEWATQYRQSGFTAALGTFRTDLDRVLRAADRGEVLVFDSDGFSELITQGVAFQSSISQSIVGRANAEVDDTRQATLIRIGVILAAVLLALVIALIIARSVTRRVKEVANTANQVATEQLPALVEAIRDPRGKAVLPDIEPVDATGGDEVSELAEAFNSMQGTLVDVAHEQVEVLRRGVSDIFVTMARRNRSLIDRQLAMLDEYEAEVDDPDVLANYYQIDHLATRMRRNSESLLVLANAEPKRRRVKATEIDDVVRASIGEVEDYRRIEVEALESLQVRGAVVADVSHLLAELLDNATSFSPPDSEVRVGGRHAGDSYMIRIVDSGVGIAPDRIGELNDLLRDPPIVGLSVEATLGISVVSLLANKHGISVTLSAGNPGLTVDVSLPSALFGPIDIPIEPASMAPAASAPAAVTATTIPGADDWNTASLDAPEPTDDVPATPASPAPVAETPDFGPSAEPSRPRDDMPLTTGDSFEGLAAVVARADDAIPRGNGDTASDERGVLDALSAFSRSNGDEPTGPDTTPPAPDTAELPPPPPATRVHGEFDVPPAPPIGASGLSLRPVTPASARPAPSIGPVEPVSKPSLPTRNPGSAPDGGPDRLAPPGSDASPIAPAGEPGALQAALSSFDSGRKSDPSELPTRSRVSDPVPLVEDPTPTSPSRLDPDALRERLRAFQTEFQSGHAEPESSDSATPDNHNDLGGDHR